MYTQVLTLHVVALVVCVTLGVMFLLFIMRPHFSRVTAESKRVAELLSNLPPEVDVEGLVMNALKTQPAGVEVSLVPGCCVAAGPWSRRGC